MQSPLRVLLLPTVTINSNQYRGRLDALAVTRALCAGFSETSEPELCLAGSIQSNDCAAGNDGCWSENELSACVDTFRGRQCQCPIGEPSGLAACSCVQQIYQQAPSMKSLQRPRRSQMLPTYHHQSFNQWRTMNMLSQQAQHPHELAADSPVES